MVRSKKSILSELNAIQCWLDTPAGYYEDTYNFGFDPNLLLFKNTSIGLSRIYDKMLEDLGEDITQYIDYLSLNKIGDDEIQLEVGYKTQVIVSRNIERVY